jgi:hypothetical protein
LRKGTEIDPNYAEAFELKGLIEEKRVMMSRRKNIINNLFQQAFPKMGHLLVIIIL